MKKRSPTLFIQDILDCMKKIEAYTKGMDYTEFSENQLTVDAVIRNIEIIGEASANVPAKVRENYVDIPWKRMVGLRNITIHEYFGVDNTIIWEIIKKNLPETKLKVQEMLKTLKE